MERIEKKSSKKIFVSSSIDNRVSRVMATNTKLMTRAFRRTTIWVLDWQQLGSCSFWVMGYSFWLLRGELRIEAERAFLRQPRTATIAIRRLCKKTVMGAS